jgi:hypothetical protein
LLASTNLQDWTPILTNLNPGATFDYTDVNVADRLPFHSNQAHPVVIL